MPAEVKPELIYDYNAKYSIIEQDDSAVWAQDSAVWVRDPSEGEAQ